MFSLPEMVAKPKVFISHTRHDSRDVELARRLARGLRERGAEVFIDVDSIPAGAEWEPQLVQSLMEKCTHFLVLLSAASISAGWVLKEIELARKRYEASGDLRILPLRMGALRDYPGKEFISRFQEVPYRDNPLAQLDAVAAALGLESKAWTRSSPLYKGKRFWIPYGEQFHLSLDGFLPDPESAEWKGWNPKVVPFEAISQTPCLVLLGEPGTGKSTALESIQASRIGHEGGEPHRTLLVDLKKCTSEARLNKYLFESAEFVAWKNSSEVLELFLDSMDECQIHIQTVARDLVTVLEECQVERLRLRIACRTAEWPELLSQELPKRWGKTHYGAYEITPLRQIDVAEAARIDGLDPEVFLKEIHARDAVPLAIKPMTLKLLISAFKKDGRLPGTQRELYEKGCLRLCEEPSRDRAASRTDGELLPVQRLQLAERIAAVTLLSKRPSIYLGNEPTLAPDECATLEDLSHGEERVGGRAFPVTPENLRETLQTGLFTGGTGERLIGWSHWTFAEFLAARFLSNRGLTTSQMKELLLRPDVNGILRVIPPLQETAAWLAGMEPRFMEELIPLDPQVLLRSAVATDDATVSDATAKARLVESLLTLLDAGKIADLGFDLRRRYDVLKHPGLGRQLAPFITDRTRNLYSRRAAIEIAEACGESSLSEELLQVALDDSEHLDIRCACVDAIGATDARGARERLRPLLHAAGDPDKSLTARVLRVLWPTHLSAERLFEYLTPPGDSRYFGSYSGFLYSDVVEHLKPKELPTALRWVNDKGLDYGTYFEPLVEGILRMAWTWLDVPGVLQEFVQVSLVRLSMHGPLFKKAPSRARSDNPLQADPVKRQRLVRALLPHLEHENLGVLTYESVVSGDDLPWLIEQLEQASEPELCERWLRLIGRVFVLDVLDHVELVLEARQRIPALARRFAWCLDAVQIDSPEAARLRAREEEQQRWKNQLESERRRLSEQRARRLLDRFEAGDLLAWHRLNMEMSRTWIDRYGRMDREELTSDLSSSPGWQALDETLRARCVAAAERFLHEADPRTAKWFGTGRLHFWASAGYRALCLLLEQRSWVLTGWSSERWARWAPLVIDWVWEEQDRGRARLVELVALAYAKAPEAVLSAVMEWLEKRGVHQWDVYPFIRRLAGCWDTRLEDALILRLRTDTSLEPEVLGVLLDELVPRSTHAVEFALELVSQVEDGDTAREKWLAVARVLLDKALKASWQHLWPMIQADPVFGEELLTRSSLYRMQRKESVRALDEDSVADLYLWLSRRLPEPEARDLKDFELRSLRRMLLTELRERGTQAAVAAIRRIAESLPSPDWLKFVVLQADAQRLRHEWQGISPVALFQLAASA